MKSIVKNVMCLVVIILSMLCVVPVTVHASDANGTIEITELATNTKQPVAGIKLSIFQIASIDDDSSEMRIHPDFSGASINLNDIFDTSKINSVVQALNAYVDEQKITALITTQTNDEGYLKFEHLEDGIYFVKQTNSDSDFKELGYSFKTESYLIELPQTNENGEMNRNVVCQPKGEIEFPDTKTKEITVYKIWKDDNDKAGIRPKQIEVGLYNDKTLVERVYLNAENNWMYQWENLDESSKWSVRELDVPTGYVSTESMDGAECRITNTIKSQKTTENTSGKNVGYTSVVKTGDTTNWSLWISLMLAAIIIIGILFFKKKKNKE